MEEEDREPQLGALQEQLSEWRNLIKSPGWKRLEKLAEAQENNRLGPLRRRPIDDLKDIFVNEYTRGELGGIELFMRIPYIQRDELAAEIDEREKLEKLKEERNNVDTED